MSLETENDLKKLRRYYDMFENLERIEFQTEIGIETANQIKGSINENIKPYLVKQGKKIKENDSGKEN